MWSHVFDPTYQGWRSPRPNDDWNQETEFKYRQLVLDDIKQDIVVIGLKDHLTAGNFNPWVEKQANLMTYFGDLFDYYSNKQFVLLTSLENLDTYLTNKNLHIVPWGGDITNQQQEYRAIDPILEKNLDSTVNFLSLNRGKRSHRAMSVCMQYGLGLQDHGLISCIFQDELENLFGYTNWQFTPEQQSIKQLLDNGFDLLKNAKLLINDDNQIYPDTDPNNNVYNFTKKLSAYYQNTFVEIISETSYTEAAFNLTEKTLNSIYGCSFPILLSSKGAVGFLRDMGLDMFDDIVDHSYDTIENPIDRMYRALVDNQELLTNNQMIKQLWLDNQHRFIKNVDFVKNNMYNFYADRAEQKMTAISNLLNE
jgi:hypothetical protein